MKKPENTPNYSRIERKIKRFLQFFPGDTEVAGKIITPSQVVSQHLAISLAVGDQGVSAGGDLATIVIPRDGTLLGWVIAILTGATNNGSNYYDYRLVNAGGGVISTISSSALSPNTTYWLPADLNDGVSASSHKYWRLNASKTGAPSNHKIYGATIFLE